MSLYFTQAVPSVHSDVPQYESTIVHRLRDSANLDHYEKLTSRDTDWCNNMLTSAVSRKGQSSNSREAL